MGISQLSNAIFTARNPGTLAASAFRANTTGLASDASDRIIYDDAILAFRPLK